MAVFAVGGLVGVAAVPHVKARLGTFTAVLLAATGFTAGTLLMGLLPYVPFVVVGIIVTGMGSSLWNVMTMSLRQRIVPSEMLGRATGVYRMVGLGAVLFGAASGGAVAHATDVRFAYVVAGMVLLAATVVAIVPLRAGLAEVPEAA